MLVEVLAYGPCADSDTLEKWLVKMGDCSDTRSAKAWTLFYTKMCRTSKARLEAQTFGNHGNAPDFMAAHQYHHCKKDEEICCGREPPPPPPKVSRKRKPKYAESDDELVPVVPKSICNGRR
jgi:hypothetical protein